jgi:hypothetical protein
MSPKISLTTAVAAAALVFGVPAAFGQGPDAFERAVNAREQSSLGQVASYRDAFERAALAGVRGPAAVSSYPDAFERAALGGSTVSVVSDSHDRMASPPTPAVQPISTGRDVEWPQIGIGFAIGVLLALGLGMALRLTRTRQLAH